MTEIEGYREVGKYDKEDSDWPFQVMADLNWIVGCQNEMNRRRREAADFSFRYIRTGIAQENFEEYMSSFHPLS